MDKEMLEALSNLLDEKLKPIHADIIELKTDVKNMKTDIKDLKIGQEKLVSRFDEIESVNATRHTDMMNELKQTNIRIDELKELKQVTKENCYDIAKLKSIK